MRERDRLQKELEKANEQISNLENKEERQQESEQVGMERLRLLAQQMKSRIEEAKGCAPGKRADS